jgi:transcriptional regulator with PAS, ATPase and Fis domain
MSANAPIILPHHFALPAPDGRETTFNLNFPREPTLEEVKQQYFERMLNNHDGNRQRAALAMGISERTLIRHVRDGHGTA